MRFAGLIENDLCAAPGISVTVFLQGCPHHCYKCHNPETWDFSGGKEFGLKEFEQLKKAISANGINRSLSIMGGEPLCNENLFTTEFIIKNIRIAYPNLPIYIWTGYTYEELTDLHDNCIDLILSQADYLIDGRYIDKLRDTTLPMRGSSNQRIINLKEKSELIL